jgi:flavin reductase (DIM6/NTAB) family NADH-FMN oxidoreductase RutF
MDAHDFGRFTEGMDYTMFVVTAASGHERSGCLIGFATQSSIDPPRLLVCLSEKNHTHHVALESELLAVHALEKSQADLAALFGEETGDEVDKFSRCAWEAGPHGVPLLEGCPRRLLGRVLEHMPLGDHTGFLLEPVQVDATDAGSLITFRDVDDFDAGHPA